MNYDNVFRYLHLCIISLNNSCRTDEEIDVVGVRDSIPLKKEGSSPARAFLGDDGLRSDDEGHSSSILDKSRLGKEPKK